jgi:hypothetical protein
LAEKSLQGAPRISSTHLASSKLSGTFKRLLSRLSESIRGNETDQGFSSPLNEIHRTRYNEIKGKRPD